MAHTGLLSLVLSLVMMKQGQVTEGIATLDVYLYNVMQFWKNGNYYVFYLSKNKQKTFIH